MMNAKSIVLLILLAVLAIPTASAHVTLYFDPQSSSVENSDTTYVRVMANVTSPDNLYAGQIGIYHDDACAEIMDVQWSSNIFTMLSFWNADSDCYGTDYDWIAYMFMTPQSDGVVEICNITIRSNCSLDYCTTPLIWSCGRLCDACPIQVINSSNNNLYPDRATLKNGTFESGTIPSAETFSKPLYTGWNLISLPLDPEDNSAGAVLSTVSYDAVYRYNATSKQFESADVMDPGAGYFVHASEDCTWEYSGTACTFMDVPLEAGLNMVGWLNCSEGVDDALYSISEDYNYVARWGTSAQKFEVHNPAAPSAFSDIATMDQGTGYFISAKQGCTLSANC